MSKKGRQAHTPPPLHSFNQKGTNPRTQAGRQAGTHPLPAPAAAPLGARRPANGALAPGPEPQALEHPRGVLRHGPGWFILVGGRFVG